MNIFVLFLLLISIYCISQIIRSFMYQEKINPTYKERILHYLGTLATYTPSNRLQISPKTSNNSKIMHDHIYTMEVQNMRSLIKNNHQKNIPVYLVPFVEWLEDAVTDQTSSVRFILGDSTTIPKTMRVGTVMKARRIDYVDRPVLLPFNYQRHWENVPIALANSASFNTRQDACIWRGATTGNDADKGSRMELVRRWGTVHAMNMGIDVGFSQNVQGKSEVLRKRLSVKEQMAYRYIISARGNDKDSGLNWKLASGSVVLMTKPHIESWLMESTLVDGVHYVRIKDDWSDLGTKVAWCRRNPDKCEAIASNARVFMHRFGSQNDEARLAVEVLKEYFARTK